MLYLWLSSGTGSGCSATYWLPREKERKQKKQRERGVERVCGGEWQTHREWGEKGRGMLGRKKRELSSLVFLLGSVQDSPSGERLALKRGCSELTGIQHVCSDVCVCFPKREGLESQLNTDWSQNLYSRRCTVHWQLFTSHLQTQHTHKHTHHKSACLTPVVDHLQWVPHPTKKKWLTSDWTKQARPPIVCVYPEMWKIILIKRKKEKKPSHRFHPCNCWTDDSWQIEFFRMKLSPIFTTSFHFS